MAGRLTSFRQITNLQRRAVLPRLEFVCPKEASARACKASLGDPVVACQFVDSTN